MVFTSILAALLHRSARRLFTGLILLRNRNGPRLARDIDTYTLNASSSPRLANLLREILARIFIAQGCAKVFAKLSCCYEIRTGKQWDDKHTDSIASDMSHQA
jgi:hypothetical protein